MAGKEEPPQLRLIATTKRLADACRLQLYEPQNKVSASGCSTVFHT